ncbi:MAG: hypothetical protein NTX45_01475 [Proteobacteria bacterium]|nr:hypothetical protein [Pseudomonadota bacterium]
MALKPVTLRLDEEEYERLRAHLSKFGDPDINVAYVLRAYIRDVNRVMPFLISSGWDLKNYFGLVGYWLKQIGSITDLEMFAKLPLSPWAYWKPTELQSGQNSENFSAPSQAEPFDQNGQAGQSK